MLESTWSKEQEIPGGSGGWGHTARILSGV